MTRLLVSVRNRAEALAAAEAGAHLIDVKEPNRGALGAADPETIAAVVASVGHRVPTSAALGELVDLSSEPVSLPRGLRFAKVGLAGCGQRTNWAEGLHAVASLLPAETAGIAVAYADWVLADAPQPQQILAWAQQAGCLGILLDTFTKRRGNLFDYFSASDLCSWINTARDAGLLTVVAGGLKHGDVAAASRLAPDYLGVRGAVCRDDRRGTVDPALVRRLVSALARPAPIAATRPVTFP